MIEQRLGRHVAATVRGSGVSWEIGRQRMVSIGYTMDKGAVVLNDYARVNDPFTRTGKESVTVQITSVVRASDTSFNVRWTERRYVNGASAGLERWTTVVSIVHQPPRTEACLRKKNLGLYVNAIQVWPYSDGALYQLYESGA